VHLLYTAQDVFRRLPVPKWVKPALAGVLVGVIALWLPQIMGVGYPVIEQILSGELTAVWLMLALMAAKLLATPISIGGGFLGGVFAPSLFIGASLGGAYGGLLARLLPGWGLSAGPFGMVGMAAVLAGAIHAPLTAIMLLFEMTNDYRIILPLMIAVAVSMALSQWIRRDSVYMLALTRQGIRIERGRDVEVLASLRVDEVMQSDVVTTGENDTLESAMAAMMKMRSHGLPVVDRGGRLVGIVSLQDIDRAQEQGHSAELHVRDVCVRDVLVAYPDEPLDVALRRMSARDVGRLPVVRRSDRRHLVGLLRRTHIVRAYEIALARRTALQAKAQQVRLGAVSGLEVYELRVAPNAVCAGLTISDLHLPAQVVVATVRRREQVIVPRGSTLLLSGDVLAVLADEESLAALRRLCAPQPGAEGQFAGDK
jgi:CIC family chloride channel protein